MNQPPWICFVALIQNLNAWQESERDVTREEGIALAKELGCLFLECSARTRENVEKCFEELALKVNKRELIYTRILPYSYSTFCFLFCFIYFRKINRRTRTPRNKKSNIQMLIQRAVRLLVILSIRLFVHQANMQSRKCLVGDGEEGFVGSQRDWIFS